MADYSIVKCDRCERRIELPRRYRTRIRWSRAPERRPPYDLCQACRVELTQWLGLLTKPVNEAAKVELDPVAGNGRDEAEERQRMAEIIDSTPRRTVDRTAVETTAIDPLGSVASACRS